MSRQYDVVMVGAGIVGLATVRELHRRHPGLRMAVLDKEDAVGRHQSGHNSGVLHAGVYYQPGSLKARLCVRGKTLMEEYAVEHGIPFESCGKLIVALDDSELGRLTSLLERGTANGVPGLREVGPEELREIEPHAAGVRALHSPGTGIIDFGRVTRAMADELVADGVDLLLGHEVTGVTGRDGVRVVATTGGEVTTRALVSCAGLHSDRVAALTTQPDVRIVPFRGDYYTLKADARFLCQGLIYPVPDPSLPFLGVHFTKRHDGEVWAGPNAVLALAREGYRRRDVDLGDSREVLGYSGFRKLARKYWRTGAHEVWRDLVKRAFVKELQRYVPEVRSDQLTFGPSGVRAQALAPDGAMVDDFHLQEGPGSLNVLNAPSPAATASLAIAELLADRAEEAFSLAS
ncbi:L-2-hydroxyglutarate oxidase [Nocardioides guangzhouensis]|uniref:L-2-hydroxyglutarate oxidase n=1 Tax=Nocardioides guangzhouensis TaxID=2497878 RepID=A0A4Q4ZC80_9ACTN|nr:L-2-hydroxyglutarate oxidase [Nocardioides guangzhouensis]RYP85573.1 L-2-hydroxyglutarate oxidase [Nocardioides guangzhouensis]